MPQANYVDVLYLLAGMTHPGDMYVQEWKYPSIWNQKTLTLLGHTPGRSCMK